MQAVFLSVLVLLLSHFHCSPALLLSFFCGRLYLRSHAHLLLLSGVIQRNKIQSVLSMVDPLKMTDKNVKRRGPSMMIQWLNPYVAHARITCGCHVAVHFSSSLLLKA